MWAVIVTEWVGLCHWHHGRSRWQDELVCVSVVCHGDRMRWFVMVFSCMVTGWDCLCECGMSWWQNEMVCVNVVCHGDRMRWPVSVWCDLVTHWNGERKQQCWTLLVHWIAENCYYYELPGEAYDYFFAIETGTTPEHFGSVSLLLDPGWHDTRSSRTNPVKLVGVPKVRSILHGSETLHSTSK